MDIPILGNITNFLVVVDGLDSQLDPVTGENFTQKFLGITCKT